MNQGRPRPDYQPKNIRCASCGAGLSIKDERAELVVCEYCGSHLDVSAAERKVVGRKSADQPFFPLQLGDSFRYRSARYEVIARLAYIEDGDIAEMTREYLLYHPRRPCCWLGEYQGHYSLTTTTHVMPRTDPFDIGRGGKLTTHDDKTWIAEGRGTYELYYVDGALPWVASVGDRLAYAEFAEEAATKLAESTAVRKAWSAAVHRPFSMEIISVSFDKSSDPSSNAVMSCPRDKIPRFIVSRITASISKLISLRKSREAVLNSSVLLSS